MRQSDHFCHHRFRMFSSLGLERYNLDSALYLYSLDCIYLYLCNLAVSNVTLRC